MRVYTAQPWEFTLIDVNFVQAVAQVVGMALEMCRINKGLKDSIDILKTMRDPKTLPSRRRTPYEGVPKSFTRKEMSETAAWLEEVWGGILAWSSLPFWFSRPGAIRVGKQQNLQRKHGFPQIGRQRNSVYPLLGGEEAKTDEIQDM
jgi:hypothetical protein